jgi:hypothetical protein
MNKLLLSTGEIRTFSFLTNAKMAEFARLSSDSFPGAILTLFGCTYRSEQYLNSFFTNLDSSFLRSKTVVILTIISPNGLVDSAILEYMSSCRIRELPLVLLILDCDPGLYSCWNYSIQISSTEFVGNANPDDIRFSMHDYECISLLENTGAHIVATSLYFADVYSSNSDQADYTTLPIAFLDSPERPSFNDLFSYRSNSVIPSNVFHCMPIWRRRAHEICGFFDEDRYGTYADWALWLQLLSHSHSTASFLCQPLGVYLVAQSSHNRIYGKLDLYANNIFLDLILPCLLDDKASICQPAAISLGDGMAKLSFSIVRDDYGSHRSDFNRFARDIAASLEFDCSSKEASGKPECNVRFVPFIEKYFGWGAGKDEASSPSPAPITQPWIGMIHVPFDYPCFIEPIISPRIILQSSLFRNSMPWLKCLIFLSENMRRRYHQLYRFSRIPTCSIKFYTDHGDEFLRFDWEKFEENPRLLHVGDWLRCFKSFYDLDAGIPKLLIKKESTDKYVNQLSKYLYGGSDWLERPVGSLEVLSMVNSKEYDFLLSSSVVFCYLFDTSANNLITECLERFTPILVNRLPAAEEYLGSSYPLFYDSLEHAESLLRARPLLYEAHQYLRELNPTAVTKACNQSSLNIAARYLRHSFDFRGLSFE